MMTENLLYGIAFVIIGLAGCIGGYFLRRYLGESKIANAEVMASKILGEAQKSVDAKKNEAILEAKEKLYKAKQDFDGETKLKRKEVQKLEQRLNQKEDHIDRKMDILEKKERETLVKEQEINKQGRSIGEKERRLSQMIEEGKSKLERIAGLTPESAKKYLLESMVTEAKHKAIGLVKRIEDEAREQAVARAKKIITLAIQRCAIDHTAETTVTVVPLPNEEMKGRIIGREGRNIRAFETATGVDLIVDDTPEAVIVSGFNVIKREIARIALEKLMTDGRIHPTRIEEVIKRAKEEMEANIKDIGERTVLDIGIAGLHPEVVKLLGKLKYRTSYGHNVLQHSIEVAYLAEIMASELGFDSAIAKRAGLLHDIGKAVDQEIEGTHPQIGADLARKYKESQRIIQAIFDHHGDDPKRTIESILVQAADSISGARPGARRETLENYVKRMTKLEEVAKSFSGVSKSYAIQAGREIRIMVEQDEISDAAAYQLSKDIAKKIEEELEYPGQIKVTVIREMRAIEYAK